MNGFVYVDKPEGITSFVAVAKIRRIFGIKKAGHTGTLDPMATGVLPIAIGHATRFIELIPNHDKAYRAKFILGKTTDTLDITGKVTGEYNITSTKEDVEKALSDFRGEIEQIPPMYSAIKKDGVRLYDLARKGIEIERESRKVTIYSLELLSYCEETAEYEIECECSSGTYIRTLIADIGEKLGCGACMEELIRTRVSRFKLEDSLTLSQVQELKEAGDLDKILVPIDEMFSNYEAITLKEEFMSFIYNGNTFMPKHVKKYIELVDGKMVRVYDDKGNFIAIYKFIKDKYIFKIEKMFYDRNEQA